MRRPTSPMQNTPQGRGSAGGSVLHDRPSPLRDPYHLARQALSSDARATAARLTDQLAVSEAALWRNEAGAPGGPVPSSSRVGAAGLSPYPTTIAFMPPAVAAPTPVRYGGSPAAPVTDGGRSVASGKGGGAAASPSSVQQQSPFSGDQQRGGDDAAASRVRAQQWATTTAAGAASPTVLRSRGGAVSPPATAHKSSGGAPLVTPAMAAAVVGQSNAVPSPAAATTTEDGGFAASGLANEAAGRHQLSPTAASPPLVAVGSRHSPTAAGPPGDSPHRVVDAVGAAANAAALHARAPEALAAIQQQLGHHVAARQNAAEQRLAELQAAQRGEGGDRSPPSSTAVMAVSIHARIDGVAAVCEQLRFDVHALKASVQALDLRCAQLSELIRAVPYTHGRGSRGEDGEDDEGESPYAADLQRLRRDKDDLSRLNGLMPSGGSGPQKAGAGAAAFHSTEGVTDPSLREYIEELNRAETMHRATKVEAAERSRTRRSRDATEQAQQLADAASRHAVIQNEIASFEKRLLGSVAALAQRVATIEGDVLQQQDALQETAADAHAQIAELRDTKVEVVDLKPRVAALLAASRDETGERLANLYDLFEFDEPSVQAALAMQTREARMDVVLGSPAIKALFDMCVKTSQRLNVLRTTTAMEQQAQTDRTLNLFHRLLGLDVSDENNLQGVRVAHVSPGGPGAASGIRTGDVIAQVNHVPILSKADFLRVMAHVLPNSVVRLLRIPNGRGIGDTVEVVASNGAFFGGDASAAPFQQQQASPLLRSSPGGLPRY